MASQLGQAAAQQQGASVSNFFNGLFNSQTPTPNQPVPVLPSTNATSTAIPATPSAAISAAADQQKQLDMAYTAWQNSIAPGNALADWQNSPVPHSGPANTLGGATSITAGSPSDQTSSAVRPSTNSLDGTAGTSSPSANTGTSNSLSSQAAAFTPQANPLHNYDDYTYGLSLHLLDMNTYNSTINNPSGYTPQNVLIASAGRFPVSSGLRDPNFTEDFFFEDFKMSTYISTTTRNRSSNLIEGSFTLVEPNGFSFIDRLVKASLDKGITNYLRQPYILQIDFFGYNNDDSDAGPDFVGPIDDLKKVLPIQIVTMKTKITTKGAEYAVTFVAFNHSAFSELYGVTPANFGVVAKTVSDLFGTGGAAGAGGTTDEYGLGGGTNGIIDAMNNHQQKLLQAQQIKVASTYSVVFDPSIASSLIHPQGGAPVNLTHAAVGKSKSGIDFQQGYFNIPAGTSIDSLIEFAVSNSDYLRNQLLDPTSSYQQGQKDQPLKWIKIIPKVELIDYDQTLDQYAYNVTYFVKPWTVNSRHPNGPTGRQQGWVKEYNYIFTGGTSSSGQSNSNRDVLDLQIDFNFMYFNKVTTNRLKSNYPKTGAGSEKNLKQSLDDGTPPTPTAEQKPKQNNSPAIAGTHLIASYAASHKRQGADQQNVNTGQDVLNSFIISGQGDMITLKLKIIGDPQFIKQDDIFYGQDSNPPDSALSNLGNMPMDSGELYVYVRFKSPIDYDETTGLAIPDKNPYANKFSGVYKVILVQNHFSRGKFEQELELARIGFDDSDLDSIPANSARIDDYLNQGLSVTQAAQAQSASGPSIVNNPVATAAASAGGASSGVSSPGFAKSLENTVVAQAEGAVVNAVVVQPIQTGITAGLNLVGSSASSLIESGISGLGGLF